MPKHIVMDQYVVLSSLGGTIRVYCLWPAFEPYPMIYRFAHGPGTAQECEAWIRENRDPASSMDWRGGALDAQLDALHSMATSNFHRAMEMLDAELRRRSSEEASPEDRSTLPQLRQTVASARVVAAHYEALHANVRPLRQAAMADTAGRGKWSDSFKEAGNDGMVLGGSIAAAGAVGTPLVPDGEVVGGAMFLAGAAVYGVGKVLAAAGM